MLCFFGGAVIGFQDSPVLLSNYNFQFSIINCITIVLRRIFKRSIVDLHGDALPLCLGALIVHVGKSGAIQKCVSPDGSESRAQGDALKSGAGVEGIRADRCDTVAYRDTLKSRAALEGTASYIRNVIGNSYLFKSHTAFKRIVTYILDTSTE